MHQDSLFNIDHFIGTGLPILEENSANKNTNELQEYTSSEFVFCFYTEKNREKYKTNNKKDDNYSKNSYVFKTVERDNIFSDSVIYNTK